MKAKLYVIETGELVVVTRKNLTRNKVLYTWEMAKPRKKNNRVRTFLCDTLQPPHSLGAVCLGAL